MPARKLRLRASSGASEEISFTGTVAPSVTLSPPPPLEDTKLCATSNASPHVGVRSKEGIDKQGTTGGATRRTLLLLLAEKHRGSINT